MTFINYAHRGASEYAPENTLAAFYLGLEMGANGIETDVQRTRDGVLVLFHDSSITRLTGLPGAISDYRYGELLQMDLGIHKGEKYRGERIVTLQEFLLHFGSKPIALAIELKAAGYEEQVACMLRDCACSASIAITSFCWEALTAYRACDQNAFLGYLFKSYTPALLEQAKAYGIRQLCPQAAALTAEDMAIFRSGGYSVRAWGVKDIALMEKMLALHVDGMTVNAPDLLAQALKRKSL